MPALVGMSSDQFLAIINLNTVQQLREGCPGRIAEREVCSAVQRNRVCRVTCRISPRHHPPTIRVPRLMLRCLDAIPHVPEPSS
jgi:hypothetical protein